MSCTWHSQDAASTPDLAKKKVHFQDNEENYQNDESAASFLQTRERDNCAHIGKYLQISPAHELLFSCNALYKNEICSVSLLLTNICTSDIAYKVRTTSPLNYRVRPSMGLVKPKTTAEVIVHLLKGSPGRSVIHDKFLVMAMPVEMIPVDGDITSELNELWHSSPKEKIVEHKIRCGILPETPPAVDVVGKIDELSASLHNEIRSLRFHLYVIVALYVISMLSVSLFIYFKDSLQCGASAYQTDSCTATGIDFHPV